MQPIFKIEADDNDITDIISQRLISLNISDETGLVSDKAEILLDNRDNILEIPQTSSILKIYLGYDETKLSFMGSFVVDNITLSSPPNKFLITAKASYKNDKNLSNQIRSPKSRSWHKYSLNKIISSIASEHKFISQIDEYYNKIYISHIDQVSESDLSFLLNLAQNYNAIIKFVSNKLIFIRKNSGLSITGKELPINTIYENEITSWRLNILNREKFGQVSARYHDFKSSKENKIIVGNKDPNYEMRFIFSDKIKAYESAKAKLMEFERGINKLEIILTGNPNLSTESLIDIPNIKYLSNKDWIISTINHELNDQGYKSTINAIAKLNA